MSWIADRPATCATACAEQILPTPGSYGLHGAGAGLAVAGGRTAPAFQC